MLRKAFPFFNLPTADLSHDLAFPQVSVKKKTCLFSEGCEKSEVVNRDSSEKVKPGALHYEMTKSSGTQLRQNSAVDKKVS